jgi:hypothetical protein
MKRDARGTTARSAKRARAASHKDQNADSRDFRPLSRNVCLLNGPPHYAILPKVTNDDLERVLASSKDRWDELADVSCGSGNRDGSSSARMHEDGTAADRKARLEAAAKLMKNREAVLRDMTLEAPTRGLVQSKQSQPELTRVKPSDAQAAEEMMREVARRLLGTTAVQPHAPSKAARKVWRVGSAYLVARLQTEAMEQYSRDPDMSHEAASALRAVLKEVAEL